jgi:hypothetical protein
MFQESVGERREQQTASSLFICFPFREQRKKAVFVGEEVCVEVKSGGGEVVELKRGNRGRLVRKREESGQEESGGDEEDVLAGRRGREEFGGGARFRICGLFSGEEARGKRGGEVGILHLQIILQRVPELGRGRGQTESHRG